MRSNFREFSFHPVDLGPAGRIHAMPLGYLAPAAADGRRCAFQTPPPPRSSVGFKFAGLPARAGGRLGLGGAGSVGLVEWPRGSWTRGRAVRVPPVCHKGS